MNEITELYNNAGVNQVCNCNTCELLCPSKELCVRTNPSFTAEKQLELIKYFSNNYNISINKIDNIFRLLFINKDGIHNFYTSGVDFAEQLALFIISRYKNQILTDAEKAQIKEVLE